jgi:hypothetical protein
VYNLALAHDAIIASRVFQTHQANKRRRTEPIIKAGSKVYLSTQNLNLLKGRVRKLLLKFLGPYEVLDCHHNKSTYTIDILSEMRKRNIHPTFHVNHMSIPEGTPVPQDC